MTTSVIQFYLVLFISGVNCECPLYRTDLNEAIDLGCITGWIPFYRPWDPFRVNARYRVFDQGSKNAPSRVISWNSSFRAVDETFDQSDRLVFIIHGYDEHGDEPWMHRLKNAYFDQYGNLPIKIISVDWKEAALGARWYTSKDYVQAATNTKVVGRVTATFIERIIRTYHVPAENIHLIGHSLGAHVTGVTISWLDMKFQIKIGKVTALDAASPVVEWFGDIIDRKHTNFLEVCHSSGRIGLTQYFNGAVGITRPFGHVDYYPNGGTIIQPGCQGANFFFCSHRRCCIFYTDMLRRLSEFCDVCATKCKTVEDAASGKCDEDEVKLWKFTQQLAERSEMGRAIIPDDHFNILYFKTNHDRLVLSCDVNDGPKNLTLS